MAVTSCSETLFVSISGFGEHEVHVQVVVCLHYCRYRNSFKLPSSRAQSTCTCTCKMSGEACEEVIPLTVGDVPPMTLIVPQMPESSSLELSAESTSSLLPENSRKRKNKSAYGDIPEIVAFLDNTLSVDDKKLFKRVKNYISALERKNNELEAQANALTAADVPLPESAKPLIEKYANSFTYRNQGQESLEWILKLIVKDSTIRYDHKEKKTKLSKAAFFDRKEHFLERGLSKVDKVLEAVMEKNKKTRAIDTVKGHSKRCGYVSDSGGTSVATEACKEGIWET